MFFEYLCNRHTLLATAQTSQEDPQRRVKRNTGKNFFRRIKIQGRECGHVRGWFSRQSFGVWRRPPVRRKRRFGICDGDGHHRF